MSTTQRRNSTITRRRGACTSCRQRKIRCDGARPCVKCEKAGVSCRYRSRSERSTGDSWDTSHSQLTFSPSPESSVHNASISLFGRGLADSRSGKELYASHDSGAGSELMDVETTFNDISWLSDTTEFFGPSQDTTTSPKIKSAVQAKERRPEVCSLDSSTLGIMSSIEQYVRTRYSKSQTGVQLFSTFVRKAVSITSSVQSHKDSKTASYNRSDATVDVDTQKELLEAFFHEPAFCSSYLRCGDIDEMISLQDRQDARLNAEKRALLNAVLALGSKVTDTSTAEDPSRYFSRSLEFRLNLIGGAASVGKIKAVVTMLVFCEDSLEQETVTSLLANALSMAQTLRLYQKAAVRALCVSEDDEIALKNLVWVLFSMEGRLNLRFGRLPLLNEDFIEHRPPVQNERKSTCAEVSLFLFYKYAQLSTAINANLFSKRALEKTGADLEEAVTSMQNLLEEWGNLIPTELSPLHVPTTASSATIQTPEGRLQLNLAYRYHEAVFAVHRRLFMPPAPQSMSPSGHPETVPTRGNGIILKSARFLLSITDAKLGQRDTSLSWSEINLPILSYCILICQILQAGIHSLGLASDISLLARAGCFCAQLVLATKADTGLAEMTTLTAVAQHIVQRQISVAASNVLSESSLYESTPIFDFGQSEIEELEIRESGHNQVEGTNFVTLPPQSFVLDASNQPNHGDPWVNWSFDGSFDGLDTLLKPTI